MLELSKLRKLRLLVGGLLLVKLALLLFFYHPLLWRASEPITSAQPTVYASPSRQQATDASSAPQPDSCSSLQTDSPPGTPVLQDTPAGSFSWEPVKQLVASLEQQRIALAGKEAQLHREQEQLASLKTALRVQLEELAAIRIQVNEALKKKADVEDEELKRLARVYEATTPEQSSTLLGKLDAKLAARILIRMNSPKAGKVLSTMEPAHAARVSEYLAKKE